MLLIFIKSKETKKKKLNVVRDIHIYYNTTFHYKNDHIFLIFKLIFLIYKFMLFKPSQVLKGNT
ncbi:hypothetical protein Hanom_Chr11g01039161 [Helianthus anomalus]